MPVGLLYLALGALAGTLSGLVGIGGGIFLIPALVYGFGFSQQQAQGTTLGVLVPPVGLAAAWIYYKQGFVDVKVALWIALGFVVGSLLGANWAVHIPALWLKRLFGVLLLGVGVKMLWGK